MKPIANFEQLEYHPTLIFDNPVPVEIESVSALTGDHGIGDARGHLVHLITLSDRWGLDIVVIWNRDTIRFRWRNGREVDYRLPLPYHLESPKRFSTYLGGLLRDLVGQSK